MANTAITFVFSVLTFYSFYRYTFQQNDFFKELSWMHLQWEIIFLASTLTAIYAANRVSNEVIINID